MSFINSLLNVFVGNKSKKDLKEVESIVKNILSHENELNLLNHNELRNKTKKFKKQIASVREPFSETIEILKSRQLCEDLNKNPLNLSNSKTGKK